MRTPETIHVSLLNIVSQLGKRAEFLGRVARDPLNTQPVEGEIKSDGTVYAMLNNTDARKNFSYIPGAGGEKDTNGVINFGFKTESGDSLQVESGWRDDGNYYTCARVFSYNQGEPWQEVVDDPSLVAKITASMASRARAVIAGREQSTGYTCVGETRQQNVTNYALRLLESWDN